MERALETKFSEESGDAAADINDTEESDQEDKDD